MLTGDAAQLIALARWFGAGRVVKLETTGPRMHVVAAVARRLEPGLFGAHAARNGPKSLRDLLDKPIKYSAAPDLFCRDLLGCAELDLSR